MIQNLTSEIKKAQDPIAFVKKYFPNPNNNYSAEKNDEIDVNLKLYLLENKLPIKITKISSGTYFYGSLKIEIYLENCCLMVKFNNEKIFLDDFNKTYLMKELSAMFYQNNNDKKMENNIKQDVPEIIISEWSQEKITIKKDQNKFSPPGKTISHSGKLGEKLKETSRGDALLSTTDNSHKKKNEARK